MTDDRRLSLGLLCAVLLAVASCAPLFEPKFETTAELTCREGGFGRDSTALADCVEEMSAERGGPPAWKAEPNLIEWVRRLLFAATSPTSDTPA